MAKQYFKEAGNTQNLVFTGDQLDIYVPERYRGYGYLNVDEALIAMGIFDAVLNGQEVGFLIPATLRMEPSEMETVNTGDGSFLKATFYEGDVFMQKEVVQDSNVPYVMFSEFLDLGRLPDFFTYRQAPFMFDRATDITGVKFNVDHAVFEIVFAYLFRDSGDPGTQYRHTQMRKDPQFIPLQNAYNLGDTTTTSKLLGSYFDDSENSALVNQADRNTELDEILRQ